MAGTDIDVELKAIKTISEALAPLDAEARERALSYAMQHLGIGAPPLLSGRSVDQLEREAIPSPEGVGSSPSIEPPSRVSDIRSLKEQKRPSTDVEMATLTAYYLRHLAPKEERKEEIGTEDIEKYFVQADYPLPSDKRYTLPNAKKAGYLESASRGKYKMNSVGHNLVAHSMPRTESGTEAKAKKMAARKTGKKTAAKRSRRKAS